MQYQRSRPSPDGLRLCPKTANVKADVVSHISVMGFCSSVCRRTTYRCSQSLIFWASRLTGMSYSRSHLLSSGSSIVHVLSIIAFFVIQTLTGVTEAGRGWRESCYVLLAALTLSPKESVRYCNPFRQRDISDRRHAYAVARICQNIVRGPADSRKLQSRCASDRYGIAPCCDHSLWNPSAGSTRSVDNTWIWMPRITYVRKCKRREDTSATSSPVRLGFAASPIIL